MKLFLDPYLQAVKENARAAQDLADEHHRTHVRGQPQIAISEEHLAVLLEYHFTVQAIANMFKVPCRTIRRRITQYRMDKEVSFSDLSDGRLDDITQQYVNTDPISGQRSLDGFLRGVSL